MAGLQFVNAEAAVLYYSPVQLLLILDIQATINRHSVAIHFNKLFRKNVTSIMPKRRSAQSLRTSAILRIGLDFGRICYGCENYSELNKLIETEGYLTVRSPLASWPASLLEDMYTIICQKKCSNYFLHSLVQPQVRNIVIQPGTIHYAIAFLQERCQALRSIALTGSHHMNPEHFIPVFKSFPRLVKIDLSENIIDDRAFDNIGATCQLLKVLNVSGSTISDLGLKFLSRSEENIPRKCQVNPISV